MKINEVAKLTGVSEGSLRLWEVRYGWPTPRRSINGYRYYRKSDVELVIRAKELEKQGHKLRDILENGPPALVRPITKKIFNIKKPVFDRKNSNEAAEIIRKSADPIKCTECLMMSVHPSDRSILQQYAKNLSKNK